MKKAKGKHLTLDNRITILEEIKKNTLLKDIGVKVSKDPTTISKEVKNNRYAKETKFNNNTTKCKECVNLKNCKTKNLCKNTTCKYDCKSCKLIDATKLCSNYKETDCIKTRRFPFVCNGCTRTGGCKKTHYYYNPKLAQENYEKTLVDSRVGVNIDDASFIQLDNIISDGIKKGKSIYSILLNHPEINKSERTIYRYVAKRYLEAKDIDLRSKVKLKPRKSYKGDPKTKKEAKVIREGRDYNCYLKFLSENRQAMVPQFDLVIGKQSDNQYLMTIIFPFSNFMLAYLIPNKKPESIVKVFNSIESKIGLESFKRLFPACVTDRGNEFIKANEIEVNSNGEKRTNVFYCDPYQSSQKPEVERNHELFRYYYPQGESLNSLTQDEIDLIFSNINSYNRESKDGRTPYEIFEFIMGKEILTKLNIKKIPFDEIVSNKSLIRNFKK